MTQFGVGCGHAWVDEGHGEAPFEDAIVERLRTVVLLEVAELYQRIQAGYPAKEAALRRLLAARGHRIRSELRRLCSPQKASMTTREA